MSLADSSAFLDLERLLAQHQAALTLLQGMLSDPACQELAWLDLACGKGQILAHLHKNLSPAEREKIKLVGYDIENQQSRQAKRIAESMNLASYQFEVGALSRFWENGATAGPWRFITITNTAHEIEPASLAEVLVRCVERLQDDGCLFLYDMERLPNPELGAVPWSAGEIKAVLTTMCRSLGSDSFEPAVGTWAHRTCNGWNGQVRRDHMGLPSEFKEHIPRAIQAASEKIHQLLEDRLGRVNAALESLAEHGPDTAEESDEKEALLYEYWALSRAIGGNV